jgi:hypothetical protein
MTEELRIVHELYVNGGQSFTPDEARFRDPLASRPEDWEIEWDEGSERMVLGRTWHDVEHHQTAMLRRDGGLLVLSAARLPVIASTYEDVRAALAMARIEDQRIEVIPAAVDESGVVRVSSRLGAGEWLAGIELAGPDWLGRVRQGLPAPRLEAGFGVSDPVLVDERLETAQVSLADAMLPSAAVSGRRVGIYFEVYGVQLEEPLQISVSAERTDRSLFGRIASALRLSSNASTSVRWLEVTPSQGTMTKHIALDLGPLDAGSYRIVIDVERETGARASSSRELIRR